MNTRKKAGLLGGLLVAWASTGLANVVVDDTAITSDLAVPAGEELEIRGSGLSAATGVTVSLADGATVKFYTTATVASAVTSAGNVAFAAEDGATGTFSGAYTATFTANTQEIALNAPGSLGKLVFGAMTLGGSTGGRFCVKGGTVETAGAVSSTRVHLYLYEGRLVLRTKWDNSKYSGGHLRLDQTQTGDACLEIAEGGSINFGNNCYAYVGGDPAHESRLLLSGGTFYREVDAGNIIFNNSGNGKGVIELAAGTFNASFLQCKNSSGSAKIILGNALWQKYVNTAQTAMIIGTGRCDVEVTGNMTIDTSGYTADAMSLMSCSGGGTLAFAEGSVLKVVGKSSGMSEFTLNHFAGGDLGLDLTQNKVKVCLPDLDGSDVDLTWNLPAATGAEVAATGASAALSVDLAQIAGGALTGDFASSFTGFSSITAGDLVLEQPASSFSYLSARGIAAIPGTIAVKAGTVLFDAEPDAQKVVVEPGVTTYCQDADPYVMTNRTNWPDSSNGWDDPNGVQSSWNPGAIAEIDTRGSNGGLDGVHVAYGLTVGGSGNHYWDGGTGRFEIGAGGITFTQSKKYALARGQFIPRIVLADNQTWTNAAASGTAYMQLGFSLAKPSYYKAYVKAAEGVTDWRIAGNLETWLYSPSNDLRNVTVTVANPAQLHLIGDIDARLNAKELVLDGAVMQFPWPAAGDTVNSAGQTVAAIDAFHLAPTVTLKDGGTLTAAQAKTPFAVPMLKAVGSGNRIVASGSAATLLVTQAVVAVTVPTANDRLSVEVPIAGNAAAFAVSGAGTLALPMSLRADVTFGDAGTLELTGDGDGAFAGTFTGAGKLVVNVDAAGTLYIPEGALDGFSGGITVSSGTLLMASAATIPPGVVVETQGTGALTLVDPAGFDRDARMDGTKNLAAPGSLVVTETAREDEQLTVGNGEVLRIFGSGLKASSTVALADGACVMFYRTATNAAPTTAEGAVTLTALANVVGTLTGAYSAEVAGTTVKYTDIEGDGVVDLAGGATFANSYTRLNVRGGHARVSAGTMKIVGAPIQMLSGSLVFTNAELKCSGNGATVNMASSSQFGDVLVEFQAGSSWTMGNNQNPSIGYSNDFESRLVLNGGTWGCTTPDAFSLCPNGRGIGIFELRAGRFYSNRRITAGNGGISKFIWTGGTFSGQWNSTDYKYDHLINGPITEFLIAGDCTLELYRMYMPVVSNFNHAAATMRALPGSSLTVVSESTTAPSTAWHGYYGGCTNVVFTNFKGDGVKLVLKKSAKNGYPSVAFADVEGPVSLTHELSDGTGDIGGLVKATGTTSELVVSYEVPEGKTYCATDDYSYWYEGFSPVSLSNLTFAAGSSYRFPVVDSEVTPLVVSGLLSLPETMTFFADANTSPAKFAGATVIAPAQGIAGADCTWTCRGGGLSRRGARMYAAEGLLKLDYAPEGLMFLVR